jgi:hypothetical protein
MDLITLDSRTEAFMKSALTIAVLLASFQAHAGERYDFYSGARQLGMGGAYTAVVNDETAVLLNPAALGKLRDTIVTVVDPELQGSTNDPKALKLNNINKVFDPQEVMNGLNTSKNWNQHYNAKAQVFPSFVTTNFGIGLLGKYQLDGQIDKTGTNYTVNSLSDYAAAMAYNMRFFGGVLKIGVGGRMIDRTQVAGTYAVATTTNLGVSQNGAEGLGLAGDAGLILTAPVEYLPSLAVVAHDIGTTSFNLGQGLFAHTGSRRPDPIRQSVDTGVSISPIVGNAKRLSVTAELRGVDRLDSDIMSRFHAGAELNIGDYFFLRGGINQRYWTAGLEFDAGLVQVQFASYGEDVGTATAHQEDRRLVAKVAIRF